MRAVAHPVARGEIEAGLVGPRAAKDDAGRVRRFDPAAPRANATVSGRSALRVGAGAGIRYLTPIGYLRFDLAFKVNPADTDLYRAPELYERLTGLDLEGVDQPGGFATFTRRLAVHISIGQAF